MKDYGMFIVPEDKPELILIKNFVNLIIPNNKNNGFGLKIEKNKETVGVLASWREVYSIELNIYHNYFICQLNYEPENIIKIKYLNDTEPNIKPKLNILGQILDKISIHKTYKNHRIYGIWTIKQPDLIKELNNIEIYLNTNKYNL